VGGLPFTRASHLRRAFAYLSLYPALLWRAWRLPRHDVVVLLTDPPLLLTLGPWIRWIKGSRLVHWAQDVYPEVAEELGVIRRRGLLAGALRCVANFALKRFDVVITVGDCMKAVMLGRGIDPSRVKVIRNWSDPGLIRPLPPNENAFRQRHAAPGEFVVMYSGNFGLAHIFEPVLDAAAALREQALRVRFLMVGSGPRFDAVKAQAQRRGLDNVSFLPPVPREQLAESLSAADAHVVTMRDGLCGLVVPSKIYGVMAAGRPVIFLGPSDSEAALTVKREQCGATLAPHDAAGLARVIREWAASPDTAMAMGASARRAAEGAGLPVAITAFREALCGAMGFPDDGIQSMVPATKSPAKRRSER
jgi:glycosyltransferase involved in cell wall biosynthesis